MQYHIQTIDDSVHIEVTGIANAEQKQAMLAAFASCQQGECSCPTTEYEKLAALHIEEAGDTVHLKLDPEAQKQFELSEIRRCLDYTIKQAA